MTWYINGSTIFKHISAISVSALNYTNTGNFVLRENYQFNYWLQFYKIIYINMSYHQNFLKLLANKSFPYKQNYSSKI